MAVSAVADKLCSAVRSQSTRKGDRMGAFAFKPAREDGTRRPADAQGRRAVMVRITRNGD
jgi:hypothetical protein